MPTNINNLIERRIMILRNGVPYESKAEAIAVIKTSAFLAAPGGKAEGLADGEPILARYWAYFHRTTDGGNPKFTEEFPTTSTESANYTFVRELDETTEDGYYKVIRVLFGVTTSYYDSSSQLTRQLEIFDNKDSVDERFAEIEAEIESIAIDLTQTDATGTDATLLSTLTLDADGRTLHKTIAKIIGSNSVNVATTVDTSATPDEKNITISLKLKGTGGLDEDSEGLYVKLTGTDNGLVTTTDGLKVNTDGKSLGINSNNEVYVRHGNTLQTTSTDGLDVKIADNTIKVDETNGGIYIPIDNDSIIYNSGSDRIEVNYDHTTIVMGNSGLEVPYDNNTIKFDSTNGFYVNVQEHGAIDTTNGLGVKVSGNYGLEIPTSGTDADMIRVKVDGDTVRFNENGELVSESMITDNFYGGQGITLETNGTDNTIKIIADVYHGNNTSTGDTVDILRFVDGNTSGTDNQVIAAKFGMIKITEGLETNVREAYQLVDANGDGFGAQIKIYKDSSLVKTMMGHTPDDLVAAWETNGTVTYYTCQGTTVDAGQNVNVYSDPDCSNEHLVGTGAITNDGGNLVLVYSNQAYTPSESDFTTKEGSGTQDDALVFIYRLADGTYSLVAINIESYLAENEFDTHAFDTTTTPHHIYLRVKDSGGIELGTGDDLDGLRIKLAEGSGLQTTTNGLALVAATSTDLGGIKLFGDSEDTGTDNYRVQLDANNKAFVNLSNFAYHHGLTVTGDGTTILDNWNPSADGTIAITSDEFITLTAADGSLVIGLNTTTDIIETSSTDALITVPTTQAVIDYVKVGSVIGEYDNPIYNTSTDNPSVMDPTILANVIYGENSSTDADSITAAVNKLDNKLAAVFNGLLEYEALNASALETVRIGTGLEQNFIYVPYADSIIADATNLYEADVLLTNRLNEVGTDITNLQNIVNQMGTDIAELQDEVDSMGTDINYLKTNKLDEVLGGNGITVSAKSQTSTDVYKQTVEIDLAQYMYTEGGQEITGVDSNLQFAGSSTDGQKKLVMTNVWDCGVY